MGSRFFMDRDGVYSSYEKFSISKEQEKIWLKEMTKSKLKKLNKKGNWNTIFFLNHHSNFEYLNEILNSKPLGKYWEKCAFLEELNKMTYCAKFSRTDKQLVFDYIKREGNTIIKETKTPERINELLNKI